MNILCLYWEGKREKWLGFAKPEVKGACEIHSLQNNPRATAAYAACVREHICPHSTQSKCLPFSGAGRGLESFLFISFSQGNDSVKDFQVLQVIHGKLINIRKFPVGMWYMAMMKEHFYLTYPQLLLDLCKNSSFCVLLVCTELKPRSFFIHLVSLSLSEAKAWELWINTFFVLV